MFDKKVIPSWSKAAIIDNMKRPAFYLYSALPVILGCIGVVALWMIFSESRPNNYTGRLVMLFIAYAFLKSTYRFARFEITEKIWAAIIFGGIASVEGLLVIGMYIGGDLANDENLRFAAAMLLIGPALLFGGMYSWRLVDRQQ